MFGEIELRSEFFETLVAADEAIRVRVAAGVGEAVELDPWLRGAAGGRRRSEEPAYAVNRSGGAWWR